MERSVQWLLCLWAANKFQNLQLIGIDCYLVLSVFILSSQLILCLLMSTDKTSNEKVLESSEKSSWSIKQH